MQTRTLGSTGLEVSEIGVGCWAIGGLDWNLGMGMGWGGVNDEQSVRGLHQAFELGANHFDTADVYGHGHSERLLGQFLRSIPRDKVIIGTKVGYFRGSASHAYDHIHMRHQLEMSLHNMGTDYIDIYYFHNLFFGDNNEYLDGAVEAMYRFKEEGKIRFIGQRGPHRYAPQRKQKKSIAKSDYDIFLEMASIINPMVIQVRYNMLSPNLDRPESDILRWCEINNIGVVMNKPLAQGLLLDKYDPDNPPIFASGDNRYQKRWFSSEGLRILHNRLVVIKERFGNSVRDSVRVALQYCLARSENAVVLAGFKNPTQVEDNLAATGKPLSHEDIKFIRKIMEGVNEELGSYFVD